jgi:ubiquinone/menaquinone biosynthesis C-methylase UbiE
MNEKSFVTKKVKSSRDVLEFYDEYAQSWDERFSKRRSTVEFHRVRLESFFDVADLKSADIAAELGVGTGPYLDIISQHLQEIICIDGSQQMLEVLKMKHGHLSNIFTLQADLEQVGLDLGIQVDLLYCFGLIEHIINTDIFIENCKRMLKPRGQIIFVTTNGMSPWYGVMRRFFRAGRHCSSDKYYTLEQLNRIMVYYGFSLKRAKYWGYFPAGVSDIIYIPLSIIGRLIARTPFRKYAGGVTASYVMNS